MSAHDITLGRTGVRFHGRHFPCTIGRGGITKDKREGDGATPTGIHRITGILYRPDRIRRPHPAAQPIRNGDLWSDDPDDAAYNHAVRAPYAPSHERLRRADARYDVVLLTDWNWPEAIPGRGSAIFLHEYWRPGYPTEGCLAFRRDHLLWITARITANTRVIVPQALAE